MRLNLAGYKWLWFDGYGRFCLKTTQALIRAGHEVYPFEIGALDKPSWFTRAQGLQFDRLTIQLMPPDMTRHLPGRSVIYSMHESKRLPRGWAEHVNENAQWLLVPAPFLVEVFKEAGVEVPIEVVKSGIDPDECQIVSPHHHGPFTFGCLADRGGRKGHDEVYTAFYKAFDHRNKDVRLLMKCRPGSLPGLDFSYSSDSRLAIWREDVESIADIYSQFDAFMFPTKCEGWGQPPREAAACGVPTVVTRWAGTDDETDRWAIPLDHYKVAESHMQDCGGDWAQPDIDELVHWMRWLYEHQDEARAKALQGAAWLRQNRTYAQSAHNLIATVSKWMGGPPPDPLPDVPAWGEPIPADLRQQLRERSNGHKAVALEQ
jgi:glycosyltransferase involved in cell wall biosynthesis